MPRRSALIAAIFQPLRRRIQHIIDSRFFRSAYDAERVLQTFGVTLRSQVDLSTLSRELVATVDEALQPEHISLWLTKAQTPARHEERERG
ncbi:MAG TPA: hypothetical protein VF510_14595 [Ktedonobacterales bacterium]